VQGSFVDDLAKDEYLGRSGGARYGTVSSPKYLMDGFGAYSVAARLYKGTYEVTDHVVKEAATGHTVEKKAIGDMPVGGEDGADIRRRVFILIRVPVQVLVRIVVKDDILSLL